MVPYSDWYSSSAKPAVASQKRSAEARWSTVLVASRAMRIGVRPIAFAGILASVREYRSCSANSSPGAAIRRRSVQAAPC